MAKESNATFYPVSVPPTARKGYAFVVSGCNIGQFHQMNGVFSAADIAALPDGQKNKPGYAYVGDKKLNRVDVGVTGRVGPVGKLAFYPEDDESDYKAIDAGAKVVFYTEGEFVTDQYDHDVSAGVSGTGSNYGDYLKLTVSGWLTEEADPTTETTASVARVIRLDTGASSSDDRLWYELL